MIFWPDHAEHISCLHGKSNIWVCFWLTYETNMKKDTVGPTYGIDFVCISSCFVDKKIVHCYFSIDKMKNWKKKKKKKTCRT